MNSKKKEIKTNKLKRKSSEYHKKSDNSKWKHKINTFNDLLPYNKLTPNIDNFYHIQI